MAAQDDYIFRLKRHAFDRGLEISGTGVRNDFVVADGTSIGRHADGHVEVNDHHPKIGIPWQSPGDVACD